MFIEKYIVWLAGCQFLRHILDVCRSKPYVEPVNKWTRLGHAIAMVVWLLVTIHLWAKLP